MLTIMKISVIYWGEKSSGESKDYKKTLPGETYISLVSSQESEIAGNRNYIEEKFCHSWKIKLKQKGKSSYKNLSSGQNSPCKTIIET